MKVHSKRILFVTEDSSWMYCNCKEVVHACCMFDNFFSDEIEKYCFSDEIEKDCFSDMSQFVTPPKTLFPE